MPDEPDASDLTPLQCAASLDFWLLFVVFGIGAGCGLMLINNLGTVSVDAQLALVVDAAVVPLVTMRKELDSIGRLSEGKQAASLRKACNVFAQGSWCAVWAGRWTATTSSCPSSPS